jgi:hypothetical protein
MVGRYIRWLRNEYGATPATIRDYEAILARMSLTLADKDPIDVTIEDLRDVIDLWAARSARTRQKSRASSARSGPGWRNRGTSRSLRPPASAGRAPSAASPGCCR